MTNIDYAIIHILWRGCAYCRSRFGPFHVDHVIPSSRGGANNFANLVMACERCNLDKSNLTAKEFGYVDVQYAAGFMAITIAAALSDDEQINTWPRMLLRIQIGIPMAILRASRMAKRITLSGFSIDRFASKARGMSAENVAYLGDREPWDELIRWLEVRTESQDLRARMPSHTV